MIPTWAASTVPTAMNDLVIPNDDPKIIISLHTYFPWQFAGEASVTWGSEQDKSQLRAEFDRIKQKWIVEENRPVILGEWGTIEDNPRSSRVEYASFYASEASERGFLTIVWDDGGMFRLLNRRGLTWDYSDIASAIVAGGN
jgi:endoglucanase